MKKITLSADFLKRFQYGTRLRPTRDWLIVILVAALFLAASVIVNLLDFNTVVAGRSAVPTASTHTASHTIGATMAQVQAVFSARAAEQAKYESGAYSFTDPSK